MKYPIIGFPNIFRVGIRDDRISSIGIILILSYTVYTRHEYLIFPTSCFREGSEYIGLIATIDPGSTREDTFDSGFFIGFVEPRISEVKTDRNTTAYSCEFEYREGVAWGVYLYLLPLREEVMLAICRDELPSIGYHGDGVVRFSLRVPLYESEYNRDRILSSQFSDLLDRVAIPLLSQDRCIAIEDISRQTELRKYDNIRLTLVFESLFYEDFFLTYICFLVFPESIEVDEAYAHIIFGL